MQMSKHMITVTSRIVLAIAINNIRIDPSFMPGNLCIELDVPLIDVLSSISNRSTAVLDGSDDDDDDDKSSVSMFDDKSFILK
jgi:hypothetical protein